jgi:hypothetical protein
MIQSQLQLVESPYIKLELPARRGAGTGVDVKVAARLPDRRGQPQALFAVKRFANGVVVAQLVRRWMLFS